MCGSGASRISRAEIRATTTSSSSARRRRCAAGCHAVSFASGRVTCAFSTDTGEKLWEARLPAGGQATQITYEANGK
ncbi:hypothetical protein [Caballeronia cordobensis]